MCSGHGLGLDITELILCHNAVFLLQAPALFARLQIIINDYCTTGRHASNSVLQSFSAVISMFYVQFINQYISYTGAVLDRIFIFVVSNPSIYGRC